jgi:membrane-associated phospholipid phosphatase
LITETEHTLVDIPASKRVIATLGLMLTVAPSPGLGGFWPSASEWYEAGLGALTSPYTWAPATGAAVTGLTGLDQTISDWAVEETPLFGSPENADDASDNLRTTTHVGMLATAVAVPGTWGSTLKRVLIEHAAIITTAATTDFLKGSSDRLRPDESDRESFPSGHSSQAFTYAAMGYMNIEALPLQESVQTGLRVGLTGLAAGTAWARVEAGVHFPSDVLAGAALGSFVGRFIQEAFLGDQENVWFGVYVNGDGASVTLSYGLK